MSLLYLCSKQQPDKIIVSSEDARLADSNNIGRRAALVIPLSVSIGTDSINALVGIVFTVKARKTKKDPELVLNTKADELRIWSSTVEPNKFQRSSFSGKLQDFFAALQSEGIEPVLHRPADGAEVISGR